MSKKHKHKPANINILGQSYQICYKNLAKESQLAGCCNPNTRKIHIDRSLNDSYHNSTLIHEILHAIFDALGFEEEYNDEHLINCLSVSLYQVLSQNDLLNCNSPLLKKPPTCVSGPGTGKE